MEEMVGAIHAAISILGTDEPTGEMRAPSPPKKPVTGKEAAKAMAAMPPVHGGGRGKGKSPALSSPELP